MELQTLLIKEGTANSIKNNQNNDPTLSRVRIFKHLMGPTIDYKESIPPAYVPWRASTTTLFLLGS